MVHILRMKSLAMINFNRISPIADFCSQIKQLELKIEILNKNVLYCTHMDDKLLKLLNQLTADKGLQKQVDEYFEDDAEEKAEQVPQE